MISDIFWILERKFFERSGWEELVIQNKNTSSTTSNEINKDNMQSYINSNFIAPAQEDQDEDEELYDDGDIRNEEEGDY